MPRRHSVVTLAGVSMPRLIYGTAWKEDRTAALVQMAVRTGFLAVDTACQPKHYNEAGVGAALNEIPNREEIFIQTKFTFPNGQDPHRTPYDRNAEPRDQVRQSIEVSFRQLGVTVIDSYVLHGPSGSGFGDLDWMVWTEMENLFAEGMVRQLGVSNVNIEQLKALWDGAQVKPSVVQNRCYASRGWDRKVRAFCKDHGIVYQGFSLLTANRREMADARITNIAERLGVTPAQVIFAWAVQYAQMAPLTGTTNLQHMSEDLAALDLIGLTPEDASIIDLVGE